MVRWLVCMVFLVVGWVNSGWGWMLPSRSRAMVRALEEESRKRTIMKEALKEAGEINKVQELAVLVNKREIGERVPLAKTERLSQVPALGQGTTKKEKKKKLVLSVGLGGGHIQGDSTYHISFTGGESELEFPLDTDLAGLNVTLGYYDHTLSDYLPKARLYCWLWRDVSHEGVLKDSDWILGDGQPGLDIYSESKTEIDLLLLDVGYIYNLWLRKHFSLGVLVGYRYQNYDYHAYDTNQVGYGIYASTCTASVEGLILRYWIKTQIPYFGLSFACSLGRFLEINAIAGASPWVKAKDMDDHVLRYKRCTSETEGHSYFAKVSGRISLTRRFAVLLNMEYWDIETSGDQYQYWYGGSLAGSSCSVVDVINSSYWLGDISLVYKF